MEKNLSRRRKTKPKNGRAGGKKYDNYQDEMEKEKEELQEEKDEKE